MAERRPLTAGLTVVPPGADPDAVKAFVTQERRPEGIHEEARAQSERTADASFDADEYRTPRKRKGRKSPVPVGLIPVTVRLKPEFAAALKRASLERQLAGEEIFTQQDLVEIALEPWLKKEGFL